MRYLNPSKNNTNLIPLFIVGTFSLHLLTLLILMFHGTMLQQVKRKALPETLVQLADGRVIGVAATGNLERNQQTIRRFIGETMNLMFTSSEKLPPQLVEEISSPLLAEEFRQKLQSKNNDLGFNDIQERTSRNAQKLLTIKQISQPEKISEGKWKVNIVANRLTFKGTEKTGISIPFNKQVFVRAIEKSKFNLSQVDTPVNLAVSGLREARLEIYNICDIKDEKCSTTTKNKNQTNKNQTNKNQTNKNQTNKNQTNTNQTNES